ncbi:MAG: YraN family protein [Nitrosomonas sp.]|nr:YraN family protein [Nitrosomonas sp.]MDP1949626.1 YraN family protein [Nitrosomonas sp.]
MKGNDAEQYAASYLQRQHLTLLQQNYRCRFGEIDLIMRDSATLVFVEVRMRSSEAFGGAAASITSSKQTKLLHTARHYISGLNAEPACRFDVVLLSGADGQKVEWIKNAFGE